MMMENKVCLGNDLITTTTTSSTADDDDDDDGKVCSQVACALTLFKTCLTLPQR